MKEYEWLETGESINIKGICEKIDELKDPKEQLQLQELEKMEELWKLTNLQELIPPDSYRLFSKIWIILSRIPLWKPSVIPEPDNLLREFFRETQQNLFSFSRYCCSVLPQSFSSVLPKNNHWISRRFCSVFSTGDYLRIFLKYCRGMSQNSSRMFLHHPFRWSSQDFPNGSSRYCPCEFPQGLFLWFLLEFLQGLLHEFFTDGLQEFLPGALPKFVL